MVDSLRGGSPSHGGDLAFATLHYGAPAEGWLDLSTGINPRPYPAPSIDAATLARLPARDGLTRLTDAARTAYGVARGADLIATPGQRNRAPAAPPRRAGGSGRGSRAYL